MNSGSHEEEVGYREVTIKSVHWNENLSKVFIEFEGSSISFNVSDRWFAQRGIDARKSIVSGRRVLIRETCRNSDADCLESGTICSLYLID